MVEADPSPPASPNKQPSQTQPIQFINSSSSVHESSDSNSADNNQSAPPSPHPFFQFINPGPGTAQPRPVKRSRSIPNVPAPPRGPPAFECLRPSSNQIRFRFREDLELHRMIYHTPSPPQPEGSPVPFRLQCPYCSLRLDDEDSLINHHKKSHERKGLRFMLAMPNCKQKRFPGPDDDDDNNDRPKLKAKFVPNLPASVSR